jgi:hypothetical protein
LPQTEISILEFFPKKAQQENLVMKSFPQATVILVALCLATGNFSGEYRIFTRDTRGTVLKIGMLEMAYGLHPGVPGGASRGSL